MTGLLWSWMSPQEGAEHRSWLVLRDLRSQAHLQRVTTTLERCVQTLDDAGVEVATIKGVTAQARWYQRPGERPCSDIDLLLAPHDLPRASVAVAALVPDHPWLPDLDDMVRSGRIQTVTLRVDGLEVDLHFDLLKLGFPTRQASLIWDRTECFELPGGTVVRVLDDTTALFHLLVHLNKDRFQRLLGLADIPRVLDAGRVDWVQLRRMAFGEGLDVPVACSLEAVVNDLAIGFPPDLPRPHGPRAALWRWIWRPSIRLRGREGRLRFRARQQWIALLARGRIREALASWAGDVLPPAPTVRSRYGDLSSSYVVTLCRGRLRSIRQLRSQRRDALSRRTTS